VWRRAQIVITAAGTRRLRDDLQSPAGGSQLEQFVLAQILVKRERLAARHAGVELVESSAKRCRLAVGTHELGLARLCAYR
jgi:hypothetical protein